ncbi:unnamed protein product [Ostreobium quekettii]|uniref:Uncharacterized protein n=1 Tax=Ostreobium quekettii TaxID=121088 RepID=A0A8S1J5F5_9CHLO|nr:unnamed protein product [Ostreobium quekettii]
MMMCRAHAWRVRFERARLRHSEGRCRRQRRCAAYARQLLLEGDIQPLWTSVAQKQGPQEASAVILKLFDTSAIQRFDQGVSSQQLLPRATLFTTIRQLQERKDAGYPRLFFCSVYWPRCEFGDSSFGPLSAAVETALVHLVGAKGSTTVKSPQHK